MWSHAVHEKLSGLLGESKQKSGFIGVRNVYWIPCSCSNVQWAHGHLWKMVIKSFKWVMLVETISFLLALKWFVNEYTGLFNYSVYNGQRMDKEHRQIKKAFLCHNSPQFVSNLRIVGRSLVLANQNTGMSQGMLKNIQNRASNIFALYSGAILDYIVVLYRAQSTDKVKTDRWSKS